MPPAAANDFCIKSAPYEYWRLTPGQSFAEVLDRFDQTGASATLTSGVFLQVAFNVAIFMPLGLMVAYLVRRRLGWALLLGLGTSLIIEMAQESALWGLNPCPTGSRRWAT